ncbi:LysR family transcriptional regulator [Bartonella sp. LJL80]
MAISQINTILNRLRLRQLRLILALNDFKSIRKAAESLGMTQPSATKILKEVEDIFGVELFERLSRGVHPTDYGETVIRYARMLFSEINSMREELAAFNTGNMGRVSIGIIPALCSGLLTQTVKHLKEKHPHLSLKIQVSTSDILVKSLLNEEVEIVIGRIPNNERINELKFEPLGEETLCIISNKLHPLAAKTKLNWRDLVDQTWVVQPHPSPMRRVINEVFHNERLNFPTSIVETSSMMTLLSFIQHTGMVGILPISVIEQHPGRELYHVLPLHIGPRLPPFGVIVRHDRIISPSMQTFIDNLKTHSLTQSMQ